MKREIWALSLSVIFFCLNANAIGFHPDARTYGLGDRVSKLFTADINDDDREDLILSFPGLREFEIKLGSRLQLERMTCKYSLDNPMTDFAIASGSDILIYIGRQQTAFNYAPCPKFETFSFPTTFSTVEIALSDLNGDGKLDIVSAGNSHEVRFRINRGVENDGSWRGFSESTYLATLAFTKDLKIEDLDGDGRKDIIVASASVTKGLWVIWTDQEFQCDQDIINCIWSGTVEPIIRNGSTPEFIEIVDINEDQRMDIVASYRNNYFGYTVKLVKNLGNRNLDISGEADLGEDVFLQMQLIELDGINGLDIAIANRSQGGFTVLLNDGDGNFRPDATYSYPLIEGISRTQSLAAIDLNGDGDKDIVTAQMGTLDLKFYQNQLLWKSSLMWTQPRIPHTFHLLKLP